jgi:signal transduction histidine kinase
MVYCDAMHHTSVKRSITIVGDLLDFTRTLLGPGIPVSVSTGDFAHARLEQVITNLIGNAIEHGEAGTAVTVTLKIHDQAGKYGAGAGLGLGLYIASAIVSAHQGSIEVETTAGKGTTFNVRIPLQVATVAQKS